MEATSISTAVELARARDHPFSDIDAVDDLKMLAECLDHTADATSKVKCSIPLNIDAKSGEVTKQLIDVATPSFEEGLRVPSASTHLRVGEHRPEGVDSSEDLPVLAEFLHGVSHGSTELARKSSAAYHA
jgi:nucleotide-binding universal stress UspA family protein